MCPQLFFLARFFFVRLFFAKSTIDLFILCLSPTNTCSPSFLLQLFLRLAEDRESLNRQSRRVGRRIVSCCTLYRILPVISTNPYSKGQKSNKFSNNQPEIRFPFSSFLLSILAAFREKEGVFRVRPVNLLSFSFDNLEQQNE